MTAMSKYTTGEMAKLAGVTVRTVQYYDSRKILVPSELSEGGRRLYSEDDLKRLKLICFLRDIGLQINSIGEILSAPNMENVIGLMLEQQLSVVQEEIVEKQKQQSNIQALQRELKTGDKFSLQKLDVIACKVKNRKELNQIRGKVLIFGLIMEAVEIATLTLGIVKGIWIPFFVAAVFLLIFGVFLAKYFYHYVAYICPECYQVFRPRFSEFFFAAHTATTRKLTCKACGHKGFCVETYEEMGKEQ